MNKGLRHVFKRLMIYAVVFYLVWCGLLFVMQDRIAFPGKQLPAPPASSTPQGVLVLKRTIPGGGEVEAWYCPAPNASAEQPAPLAAFCHGNYELIDDQLDLVRFYHSLGVSVLLPEFRGYGRSAGQPGQAALTDDAAHFLDQMLQRPEVDASRVVVHGRSIGGAVAAQLADRRPPKALILQSTMTSVASMAHGYGAPGFLVKNQFRTDRVLAKCKAPVLIMHGRSDRIISPGHSRRLAALADQARHIEFDCGHNDFPGYENVEAYGEAIESFLADAEVINPRTESR